MNKLKFKLYDKKKNEIVEYMNCSISIVDGEVQSFDSRGMAEGTFYNNHLIPIQYTNKNDIDGNEIYQGFIIKRIKGSPFDREITGVVTFLECGWWIINEKEKQAAPLFDEIAIDRIVGNIYQNPEFLS